jgi:hypothetical protein
VEIQNQMVKMFQSYLIVFRQDTKQGCLFKRLAALFWLEALPFVQEIISKKKR